MPSPLTVFYDGACPLCRAEVAQYQRADRGGSCVWVDASRLPSSAANRPSRAELLARLHVRDAEGRWWSGAAAFARLWQQLPGWAWLGRLAARPGLQGPFEAAYRLFLRLRPLWRGTP